MTENKRKQSGWQLGRKMLGLVLAAVTVIGLTGLMTPRAEAGMEYYLDKVVEWGVMRGDINGNLNPDRPITRAEFVTLVNRAYGYKEMGPNPFSDISSKDWFYEDVCIANKVGYFKGTTPTTASPRSKLTREQAAVIIGRNMMLEQGTGEALGFTDSRKFGDWSRHMIQAVSEQGIITGYSDGSFRPKNNVTRGQVAAMLVRAVGTPVQQPGEQSLGGVYGNVTITSPGVKLKDTTIYGDLYVSGGVGLGGVELENVKVMGKIVVSGTGESEKGEHSVVLRNVTADELVMDSLAQQFVTLKSEGLTNIGKVNVRTGAYLEDLTEEAYGLKNISLDGAAGTKFQLAGNIKDVTMKTTNGELTLAQGIANSITVDESAKNTTLNIANQATGGTVNLDAATTVTGTGDVGHMNVNAPGTKTDMLPDTIVVRPGITADIKGEVMDSVAAEESSADPRLLSGYPLVKNVSPKDAEVVFKTNKKGTIYWAVTSLMDGSVSEAELLNPPVYSKKILQHGTVSAEASSTEYVEKINNLISDGSYYLSAILVDNRDKRSPVKFDAFTTPDDTVPNFASGYPVALMTENEDGEQVVQARVMPTKNCLLYYALLPKGAVAPKPADFKANSVSGNLGFNVVEVRKNTPHTIPEINTAILKEETEYDLYLWLTDADGVKSSSVKKLTVKTKDKTPPQLLYLKTRDFDAKSVTLTYAMDEPGTLYWAVVKEGKKFYMDPSEGFKDTDAGKAQVETGVNSLKRGNSSASKGDTDVSFTVSGLEAQTAYDLYYVVKDKAGNYGIYRDSIKMPYPIRTLDDSRPTVKQEFTVDGGSTPGKIMVEPITSVRLVFSENVRGAKDENGELIYHNFLEAYKKKRDGEISAKEWGDMVSDHVKLYHVGTNKPAKERNESNAATIGNDWVVDYRNAEVVWDPADTGEVIMKFPYRADSSGAVTKDSALNLMGSETYQFRLTGVEDMSDNKLTGNGSRGVIELDPFTTVAARLKMTEKTPMVPKDHDGLAENGKDPNSEEKWIFDVVMEMHPEAHLSMPDEKLWDLIIWSDTQIDFKVYLADKGTDGKPKDWKPVKNADDSFRTANITPDEGQFGGVSLGIALAERHDYPDYEPAKMMEDRFIAIEFTKIRDNPIRADWNTPLNLKFTAVTGEGVPLAQVGEKLASQSADYHTAIEGTPGIQDITYPNPCEVSKGFIDITPPEFKKPYPQFEVGESNVSFKVMLNRPNSTYYYMIAPAEMSPASKEGQNISWDSMPKGGDAEPLLQVDEPRSSTIMYPNTAGSSSDVIYGRGSFNDVISVKNIEDLKANTEYVAYFVLQGQAQQSYTKNPWCFAFKTGDLETPVIQLSVNNPKVGVKTSTNATGKWILMTDTRVKGDSDLNASFVDKVGANRNNTELTSGVTEAAAKDAAVRNYFEKNFRKYFPNANSVGEIRVIDAMTRPIRDGQMTVFDKFAGNQIYQSIVNKVKQAANDPAASGDLQKRKDDWNPQIAPQGMQGFTNHYFIAIATNSRNTENTGYYGVAAIYGVHNVDQEPPEILSYPAGAIHVYQNRDEQEELFGEDRYKVGNHYYSGKIVLTFDKKPYLTILDQDTSDSVTIPLTTKILQGKDTEFNKLYFGDEAGGPLISGSNIDIQRDSITMYGETIEIPYKNAQNGGQITLFTIGYVGNPQAQTIRKLQLTYVIPPVNTEKVDPVLVPKWLAGPNASK